MTPSSVAPPLVVDLGNHSVRLGFAGSAEPQMIFPNAVATITDSHLQVLGNAKALEKEATESIRQYDMGRSQHLIGQMRFEEKSIVNLIRDRRIRDEERGAKALHRVFGEFPVKPLNKMDDIEVNPIIAPIFGTPNLEYRVNVDRLACTGDAMWGLDSVHVPEIVFTEPIPGQTTLKKQLFETAFETWMAPSCLSAPSQLFQAAGAATPSSLVVDVGHTHMTTCYVVDGYVHPSTVTTTRMCVNDLDEAMLKKLESVNGRDKLKPLSSFFTADGQALQCGDIETGTTGFGSHPMPFTNQSALAWQKVLLAQIIREHYSDDSFTSREMDSYVLPDGTLLKTDGQIYSKMSSYLCGKAAIPKPFLSKYWSSQPTSGNKRNDGPALMSLDKSISQTAEAILSLHKTKSQTKKKTKSSERTTVTPLVALPERVTLTGGGSLLHGFDENFLRIFHEDVPPSIASIGMNGPSAINYANLTSQTASALWEDVQKNPTCTNAILKALRFNVPGSRTDLTDPPVHIVAGHDVKDRTFLGYRGASIIASVGSFPTLTLTLEDYLEQGPDRAITKMPI